MNDKRMYANKDTRNRVLTDAANALVEMVPVYDEAGNILSGYDLVRDHSEKFPIGIFAGRFAPVQHLDVVKQIFGELDTHIGEGNYDIVDWKLNHQERRSQIKMSVSLPNIPEFDIDGSKILPVMNIRNSNDGSCSLMFDLGGWRSICSNGLSLFRNMKHLLRKRHTHSFVFEALDFEKIADEYDSLKRIITKSQQTTLTEEMKQLFIKSGFSKRIMENLPEFFEKYADAKQETIRDYQKVWAVYQILTNWITNVVENKNVVLAAHYNKKLNQVMNQILPVG